MTVVTHTPLNPIATNTLRGRHLQLAHQVRHTFERIGIEHRNDDGTVFVPRVKRIAWTPDGDIALIELDESRLWHIPSTRLTNPDTLADQHFAAIRAARLDNWHDFNSQSDRRLPAIHVVVDELPDFVFQSGGPTGEFATLLARLAGKVLGAGVFLTIAGTQMGSDVLPPLLRANMITRIAFQTSDRYKSLAVLNEVGAEKLPAIKGRALWRDAERPTQLIETQMVYLDGEDVDAIVALNGLSGDESAASEARPFVPTIAGVRPELAREIAEWVVRTGQTDVRSVWAEFRGKGLARNKAISLLNEWEAVGLLGSQETARDPRPVLQPFRDRLGLGSENDLA